MLEERSTAANRSYESFIVRVFMDGDGGLDHGEALHVSTKARVRFGSWEEALRFMAALARSGQPEESADRT